MRMDEFVKQLPKDGTPVRIVADGHAVTASYQGEFEYDDKWGNDE
jgi:hypothetical protein